MKHGVSLLDKLIIDLCNDGSELSINTISCEVKNNHVWKQKTAIQKGM